MLLTPAAGRVSKIDGNFYCKVRESGLSSYQIVGAPFIMNDPPLLQSGHSGISRVSLGSFTFPCERRKSGRFRLRAYTGFHLRGGRALFGAVHLSFLSHSSAT